MKLLTPIFALVVLALVGWHGATVPNYRDYQFACAQPGNDGGDAACEAEELRVFGTIRGNNPVWLGRFDPADFDCDRDHSCTR